MMRSFVIVLLLANGAVLAWSQGWLAPWWQPPWMIDREPERMAKQVKPESIVWMAPAAAQHAASAVEQARAASAAEAAETADAASAATR